MKIVICCQHCIRLYEVDPSMNGKLGRCDACKAYFTINVAEYHHPGEEALNLTNPIEPSYAHFHDAAAGFARSLRDLFDMASERLTTQAARRFALTMARHPSDLHDETWRSGYCHQLVSRTIPERRDREARARWEPLADYFLWHFPAKPRPAREILINALTGFLTVEFDDMPPGREIVPYRKRGPLERWAARRGW